MLSNIITKISYHIIVTQFIFFYLKLYGLFYVILIVWNLKENQSFYPFVLLQIINPNLLQKHKKPSFFPS
jgi:hypothetical protein